MRRHLTAAVALTCAALTLTACSSGSDSTTASFNGQPSDGGATYSITATVGKAEKPAPDTTVTDQQGKQSVPMRAVSCINQETDTIIPITITAENAKSPDITRVLNVALMDPRGSEVQKARFVTMNSVIYSCIGGVLLSNAITGRTENTQVGFIVVPNDITDLKGYSLSLNAPEGDVISKASGCTFDRSSCVIAL